MTVDGIGFGLGAFAHVHLLSEPYPGDPGMDNGSRGLCQWSP